MMNNIQQHNNVPLKVLVGLLTFTTLGSQLQAASKAQTDLKSAYLEANKPFGLTNLFLASGRLLTIFSLNNGLSESVQGSNILGLWIGVEFGMLLSYFLNKNQAGWSSFLATVSATPLSCGILEQIQKNPELPTFFPALLTGLVVSGTLSALTVSKFEPTVTNKKGRSRKDSGTGISNEITLFSGIAAATGIFLLLNHFVFNNKILLVDLTIYGWTKLLGKTADADSISAYPKALAKILSTKTDEIKQLIKSTDISKGQAAFKSALEDIFKSPNKAITDARSAIEKLGDEQGVTDEIKKLLATNKDASVNTLLNSLPNSAGIKGVIKVVGDQFSSLAQSFDNKELIVGEKDDKAAKLLEILKDIKEESDIDKLKLDKFSEIISLIKNFDPKTDYGQVGDSISDADKTYKDLRSELIRFLK